MIEKTARVTSYVLNPFLVSFMVLVLLATRGTSGSPAQTAKWAAVSLALSVLPVFAVVLYLVRQRRLDGIFVRQQRQRTGIYILASAMGAAGCLVLWASGAPRLLLASFVAGFAAVVTFTVINLSWKISAHTAFVAASAVIMTFVYGAAGALTLLLVLLVGWARLRLKLHSPAQVAAGAVVAGGIVAGIFWAFGMA
jgi:membrane-associated phospholipid phosphatase